MKDIYLSVIIPAYNESSNTYKGDIELLLTYLSKQTYSYEVIFIDDGSLDNTLKYLKSLKNVDSHVRVIANKHQGKALTVIKGLLGSQGKYCLFTDFDQSTPITEIEKLTPFINKGYDIVIGSREVKGSLRANEPKHRHIMGKVFNIVVSLFTVRGIHDTQCGFKLLSRKAIDITVPKLSVTNTAKQDAFTGAFDVEILFIAQKYDCKIAEVPVRWNHVESERVNPIKDSLRMFLEVVKIRLADIRGKYE